MKNQFLLLCLFAFFFIEVKQTLDASAIKAIVICDTRAQHINDSVEKDFVQIQTFLKELSEKINLPLERHFFTAQNINNTLEANLEDIKADSSDLIFFFFSGHGYRTEQKGDNNWPYLFLTQTQKGIDFSNVIDILKEKKPRLLIAISDCCNNVIPDKFAPPSTQKKTIYKASKHFWVEANWKKLFLESSGALLIASSKPGEFAWGTAAHGGVFTQELVKAIKEAVKQPDGANWGHILNQASTKVLAKKLGQTPQWVDELKPLKK